MNSVVTMRRTAEMSPRTKARMAGGFFLATILTGVFTQQFISSIVVSGDAEATAANVLSHESVFRLGFAVYLVPSVPDHNDRDHVRPAEAGQQERFAAGGDLLVLSDARSRF